MTQRRLRYAIAPLLFALAGCVSAPQEHFYTLGPAATPPSMQPPAFSIGVGPVTVPAIVDRQQMVLRIGDNQVMVTEQSRWAQPLEDEIARAVADDLAQLLRDIPVRSYVQSGTGDARYRVRVDVQHFDSTPGVGASIDILWSIRDAADARLDEGRSVVSERAKGDSIEALVAAQGRALDAASRDIAASLRAQAGLLPK